MKKFIMGVLLGSALTFSVPVFANNGEVVATLTKFKVLLNGKFVELKNDIIVINGTSYVPLREVSNLFGHEVDFDGENGIIGIENDGQKHLEKLKNKNDSEVKLEDTKQLSDTSGQYIKDLQLKYSKDGKLDPELIKRAIEKKKLSVNAQDEDTGNSLLILAIIENNFPVYQVLKDNGVDAELPNKEGNTPLHFATLEKSSFYMGELLNHFNVKAKVKNNEGKMPIDLTQKNSAEYRKLRIRD
ncbi:stalk domain-containing protein [Paenibacillus naphthalenovorans]|uniref:Copper amine oxidase n=1 Tax=Paenibacillus naphthalenovorans TaxID=162209 RepID=A0A0U2UK55_9BACL|nr:ankyrin repeat domain-containing protein [Paenibacillus naphthalenovorans]ALS22321.1 copper amine oxidase [Paenibacillus naphthalenovorans]